MPTGASNTSVWLQSVKVGHRWFSGLVVQLVKGVVNAHKLKQLTQIAVLTHGTDNDGDAGSMHGAHHYLRASKGWSAPDREQHRKAARIALDTSAHAGSHYHNFMRLSDDQVCLLGPLLPLPPLAP